MIRDRDDAIRKWYLHGHGETPPPFVGAAFRARDREEEIERNARFAEPYRREDGTIGNVADLIPELYEVNKQFDLKLGSMSKRSLVRLELAHAIETRVTPLTADPWIRKLPARLREARKSFCLGFRPSDGRKRVAWDLKCGLSRICPDDAREDAMRMQRRVIDPLLEFKKNGRHITYCVFTLPNYQPGSLRTGIKAIYRRFGALLKKRQDGELKWQNLEAAMCVLEAPLAHDRTWNVHLNVMFVHRGFLDWRELQKDWGAWVKCSPVTGGREGLERALREIIKYSARAVAEKSEDKATREDRSPPAMSEWTGEELLEWLLAFRGFRRTRTYRALYRLAKPAKDSLAGYLWVGKGEYLVTGWRLELGPLSSIPGDKSTTPDALERWNKWLRGLKPPDIPAGKCERFA
jgi:hypothetical protein